MHWLDRLATRVIRSPRLYPRVFPDGWGDTQHLERLLADARTARYDPRLVEPHFRLSDDGIGTFTSPSSLLDPSMRTGRVMRLGPELERQVVLMAASNDHAYGTRLEVAERLLNAGIGSLILEQPFYGDRRRHSGPQPIRTVVDFVEMSIVAPLEGVGLTMWLADHGVMPGVAGFSQGGSNAAVIGALSPNPIAVTPMAASHSSSPVFTEGILTDSVDWSALGGRDDALPRLRAALANLSLLHLSAPPHTAAAVFGIARGDGYVAEDHIQPTIEHWPGAEAVYIDPGHAGFHLWGKQVQADLITRSFDRLSRLGI